MPISMREDIAVLVVVLSVDTLVFLDASLVSGGFIMVVESSRMVIGVVELVWGRFE